MRPRCCELERPPRAVRYSLDLGARTATLIEEKDDPGTVQSPLCCGSARKLPGGDWVMSWGSSALITELAPDGSRVFSLTFYHDWTQAAIAELLGVTPRHVRRLWHDACLQLNDRLGGDLPAG